MRYLYKYGLIVGRFQMLHNGHKKMIETALDLCERVIVFIGSSQESGTEKNPFSYIVRAGMIESSFDINIAEKRLIIMPLPDIGAGNNDIWGRYVLGLFEGEFHRQPDLYITGYENIRSSWFNEKIAPNVNQLILSRGNKNISASYCRKLILEDKKEEWQKLVPSENWKMYDFYRDIIIKINKEGEKNENISNY